MMTGDDINGLIGVGIAVVFGGGAIVGVAYFMLKIWYQGSQCLPRANEVATALGATVKTQIHRKEKTYHVIGERSGYQARLVFGGRRGEIEVKPAGDGPGIEALEAKLGGIFQHVQYDPEAKADARNQLNADHWNEREQQKYFLSQHVYFEGAQRSLRPLMTFWNQLPAQLTGAIVQQMEAKAIHRVSLSDNVKIMVENTAVIRPGFALQMLDLAVALATAINAPGYVAA